MKKIVFLSITCISNFSMGMTDISMQEAVAMHGAKSLIACKKNDNRVFTFVRSPFIKIKRSKPIPKAEMPDKKSECEEASNQSANTQSAQTPSLALPTATSCTPSPQDIKTQAELIPQSEQSGTKNLLAAVKAIKRGLQSPKNFFLKSRMFMVNILEIQTHIEEVLENVIKKDPNTTSQEFIRHTQQVIDDALRIYLSCQDKNTYEIIEERKQELKIELLQTLHQEFGIASCV